MYWSVSLGQIPLEEINSCSLFIISAFFILMQFFTSNWINNPTKIQINYKNYQDTFKRSFKYLVNLNLNIFVLPLLSNHFFYTIQFCRNYFWSSKLSCVIRELLYTTNSSIYSNSIYSNSIYSNSIYRYRWFVFVFKGFVTMFILFVCVAVFYCNIRYFINIWIMNIV